MPTDTNRPDHSARMVRRIRWALGMLLGGVGIGLLGFVLFPSSNLLGGFVFPAAIMMSIGFIALVMLLIVGVVNRVAPVEQPADPARRGDDGG